MDKAEEGAAWDLADAQPVYVTEWPENAFTSHILKPQNGEIDHIYDYRDSGRYAVCMKEISMEQSEAYVEALKEQGYSDIISDENAVSVGTMLKKGDVSLSISYSGTILAVLITTGGDT